MNQSPTNPSPSSPPRHVPTPGLYGWITHTELASSDPASTKACAPRFWVGLSSRADWLLRSIVTGPQSSFSKKSSPSTPAGKAPWTIRPSQVILVLARFDDVSFSTESHPVSSCADSSMDLPPPVQDPADQQHYPNNHQPQGPAESAETNPETADSDDQFEEKRPNQEERGSDQR